MACHWVRGRGHLVPRAGGRAEGKGGVSGVPHMETTAPWHKSSKGSGGSNNRNSNNSTK